MKTEGSSSGESGFSLVEIVVSMFLIGVLAISVLPVFIQALTASATNITIATATQMVNDQMDLARASVKNCAELTTFVGAVPPPVTDSQKVVLRASRTSSTCSDAQLDAAALTITVTRSDTNAEVAEATTLLSVNASAGSTASPTPTPGP